MDYKLLKATISNVQRVELVEVEFKDNALILAGKNGQGKSSIIKAIWTALGGRDCMPEMSIRQGEEKASVVLEFDEFIVTRTWTSNEKSYLKVSNKDGFQMPSAQTFLDKIQGKLTLDPIRLVLMDKKERFELFKNIKGLNFDKERAEYKKIYDERTDINKDLKKLEGEFDSYKDIPELPQLRSIEEIEKEKAEIQAYNDETKKFEDTVKNTQKEKEDCLNLISKQEEHIENINQKIKELEKQIDNLRENKITHEESIKENKTFLDVIENRLKEAVARCRGYNPITHLDEEIKLLVAAQELKFKHERKAKLITEIEETKKESEAKTQELKKIEAEQQDKIKNTAMPIQGLNFGDNDILYNNIPFDQLSSSEQISVSMSVAMSEIKAKQAKGERVIKLLTMTNLSLLDAEAQQAAFEIAEKEGFQVIAEIVANSPIENALFISDGKVVEQ